MKEILLTQGQKATVDDDVFESLNRWRWYARFSRETGSYYAMRNAQKHRIILMHRQVIDAKPGQLVDHRDHDTLNNKLSNLRLCDYSLSNSNRKIQCNNKSGFIGVFYRPQCRYRPFRATVRFRGDIYPCGYFATAEEAANARDLMAMKIQGEFAVLNFPQLC